MVENPFCRLNRSRMMEVHSRGRDQEAVRGCSFRARSAGYDPHAHMELVKARLRTDRRRALRQAAHVQTPPSCERPPWRNPDALILRIVKRAEDISCVSQATYRIGPTSVIPAGAEALRFGATVRNASSGGWLITSPRGRLRHLHSRPASWWTRLMVERRGCVQRSKRGRQADSGRV